MNGEYTIKFEINVAAQRMISQIVSHNEEFEKQLEAGIKQAVDEFDFKEFSRQTVDRAIREAIQSSASWGNIRQMAVDKANKIVDEYISKEMENFKTEINTQMKTANDQKI